MNYSLPEHILLVHRDLTNLKLRTEEQNFSNVEMPRKSSNMQLHILILLMKTLRFKPYRRTLRFLQFCITMVLSGIKLNIIFLTY